MWVGNVVNSTGAAGSHFCKGPGCASLQSIWWAGYGVYQNVTVKNNYADLCGVGAAFTTAKDTTGPPNFHCAVPEGAVRQGFGGAAPEASAVEGGNVLMTNGACLQVFRAQKAC